VSTSLMGTLFWVTTVALFVSLLLSILVGSIIGKSINAITKSNINFSKKALNVPLSMIFFGGFLSAFNAAISDLNMTLILGVSKGLVYAGLVVFAWKMSSVLSDVLIQQTQRSSTTFDDLLVPLINRTLKISIGVFGFIGFSELFQLPLSSVLAGLGIGGIAIAMAAKDTIANIFGSLTVVIDRPFGIGDWVKINDVEGVVEDLGFRSTKIRTFYNSLISVPNALLLTSSIDNLGARSSRRISIRLGIAYNTPPSKIETFCSEIRQLIQHHPNTAPRYHVYFNQFASSSLEIMVYFFVTAPDWETELSIRHDLFISFLNCAASLGVSFAFPTQTLYLNRQIDQGHE
jgi:MscS family membrane protein